MAFARVSSVGTKKGATGRLPASARQRAGPQVVLQHNISLELSEKHSKQLVKHIEIARGAILQILITAVPKDLEYNHGKKALMDKLITAVNRSLENPMVDGLRITDAVIL